MLPVLDDYLVTFTREEAIFDLALTWRREAGEEYSAYFNIIDFIERVLSKKLKRGPLNFNFFDMELAGKLGFVTFRPTTLHIDREVWELGKFGDPESRFILAHEIGHLVLHDHHAKSFSNNLRGAEARYQAKEYSAEWQANTFAMHLLLPDHIVLAYGNPDELANACSVSLELAKERFEAVMEARRPKPRFEGNFCIICGDFTERRNGSIKCVNCGN